MESKTQIGTKTKKRMDYSTAFDINAKTPPQAVDVEEALLGALMLDSNALNNVIDLLHEEYFYRPENQAVFRAIHRLFEQSKPVELVTVVDMLRHMGDLENAGGPYRVSQLSTHITSGAHAEYYARILSEKFIQRELIRISTETITDAYEETTDVISLLDKTETHLMDINDKNFRSDYKKLETVVGMVLDQIKAASEKPDGLTGLPSGLSEMDRVTSGFQPGTLIILAARPAMGKTALAMSIARNLAVQFNEPVAFFSLEMPAAELGMRLMSGEAHIDGKKLKRGTLMDWEKDILEQKAQVLNEAPLYIDDTPGLSIFELRAKCRRLKQRFGIKMIFVDYLQLMTGGGEASKNGNREQEISMISRQLKGLSKELGVPILALSQLSRAVETRGGSKVPQLSDLRESGAIEQDADIVIFIHRPEYYGQMEDEEGGSTQGKANIIFAKHRSGETGNVWVKFEGQFARFSDCDVTSTKPESAFMPNENFDGSGPRTMTLESKNWDRPDNGSVPPDDFMMPVDNDLDF